MSDAITDCEKCDELAESLSELHEDYDSAMSKIEELETKLEEAESQRDSLHDAAEESFALLRSVL